MPLYTDLCINDRLQRQGGLRMADIYHALARGRRCAPDQYDAQPNPLWTFYMRIYEHLWKLDRGVLAGAGLTDAIDTDAWLGARLVRAYASEWMTGAGRFATLVLPCLLAESEHLGAFRTLHDTDGAAVGCAPGAVHEIEPDEAGAVVHPLDDPRITGDDADPAAATSAPSTPAVQARQPFEYGEILEAAGIALDDHEVAMRYYREHAQPHLIPFPMQRMKPAAEPLLAAVEPWDIGEPLDRIDWLHSLMLCPRPIPGLTTVQRGHEADPGRECVPAPVDLDLYVDSSGSMPNPQRQMSCLALAGAIIALSALRAGASVQTTLWSGKTQVLGTDGFVRDGDAVLRVLTGFFGGATCFPIHRLRDTHTKPTARARPAHILMISDDGITTMFDRDEKGNSGWDIAAQALRRAGAGGTMALSLPSGWKSLARLELPTSWRDLVRARDEQGWDLHAVADMAQLVAFARAFSRRRYGGIVADAPRDARGGS